MATRDKKLNGRKATVDRWFISSPTKLQQISTSMIASGRAISPSNLSMDLLVEQFVPAYEIQAYLALTGTNFSVNNVSHCVPGDVG